MSRNVADVRVKKRLCLHFLGQSVPTCKKYATFFVFCLFLLFGSNRVKASDVAPDIPDEHLVKTVTVSAVVPLTDTFTYLIRKNSTVIFKKKAFVLGEEGEIRVSIRGGKGEILRDHHIMGRIFDVRHEEVASFSGVTDSAGKVMFRVKFTKRFFGKNTVQVADMTYGEPLFLMEQSSCIVYEGRDAQEKAKKDGKRALTNGQMTAMRTLFTCSAQPSSDFLEKSATIVRYPSVEACSRAGPT